MPDQTNVLASPPRRQAILVLGMHRSGTSSLAGTIHALGAATPKILMAPQSSNPRGHFESALLEAAHNELLAAAGSHWHDWRQFTPLLIRSEVAEEHRQKIKAIIIKEFGDEPLIVFKDPRVCRFVPFTASILTELNFSVVAILTVRNPLEVAYSLKRRDGFALSKSILLWLRHVLDAEFHSRHMQRCILSYEDFLSDWRYHLDRAAEKVGIRWPDRSDRSGVKIDQFLTLDLRHERVPFDELNEHPEVTSLVRECYRILTDLAASGEMQELMDQLDKIRTRFDEDCQLFGASMGEQMDTTEPSQAEVKSFEEASRLVYEAGAEPILQIPRDVLRQAKMTLHSFHARYPRWMAQERARQLRRRYG